MRKITFTIAISLLACILMSTSCGRDEDDHYGIMFVNNSDKEVFVRADWWYPDTVITFGNPARAENEYLVAAHSNSNHPLSSSESYEKGFSFHERFMVFVMDAELVRNTPWDTVKSKYLVLKRYDLSFDDLDSMNWTITYQ